MPRKFSITIVGPGRLGTALARSLHTAGIRVAEIAYRKSSVAAKRLAKSVNARAVAFEEVEFLGEVIWLCVADAEIAATAKAMAKRRSWEGTVVFHSSGALSADELAPLRRRGAKVASVHPMMTFVRNFEPSIHGVVFSLEGDAAAVKVAGELVKHLGGESFSISRKNKPLYHALGAFVSPLIVAQMATAERIGRELGLKPQRTRKIVAPILQQTVRNYLAHGPAAAFSGPIVRGDAATVRKNLAALKRVSGAAEIYRALARAAVEELPGKDAAAIGKAIRKK
jgi:predicted short-subunit dehydrogenase-like oxidoreductase (DUF2520 family)